MWEEIDGAEGEYVGSDAGGESAENQSEMVAGKVEYQRASVFSQVFFFLPIFYLL